jgi:murein DD-endopeptidase MepM/ murein hydrolase activator NlpD
MQVIITDAWVAKSQSIHLTGTKLVLAGLMAATLLMLTAVGLYHWVFLKGAREGWPVIGSLVRLVVKDEFDQRDKYLRENIDVMAKRVGEMQARMVQIDALVDRVASLSGVKVGDLKLPLARGGLHAPANPLTGEALQAILSDLNDQGAKRLDLLTVVEQRLFEQRLAKLMVPSQEPVAGVTAGSPFGWRTDPFNGSSAMHTGLDFQAETGTPILAAAGGLVVNVESHPGYGNMIEIDHGNKVITRYAHCSQIFANKGDLVRRGQKIAAVGSTGRSTGPHLHFEVLLDGVQTDPQKFLDAGKSQALVQDTSSAATSRPVPARR